MIKLDPRDERIAFLETLVAKQAAVIARLEARVKDLEDLLRTNSNNSSKPPSSDPHRPKKPWVPTGRKRGGQKGHEPHERALLPVEEVDQVVHVQPAKCSQCHGEVIIPGNWDVTRHQVFELPKILPEVTEYQLQNCWCEACQRVEPAQLPPGVPQSGYGPRAEATVSLFTGKYRLGKRGVRELFRDLFGFPLATGTVCKIEQRMSAALAEPYEEAKAYVQAQGVGHGDETSWREDKKKAWLWVAGTTLVTVFAIQAHRSKEAAQSLWGKFRGFFVSDRYNAYLWIPVERRQICWSHISRDFEAFSERKGSSATIGFALLDQAEKMFRLWYRVRDGTMDRGDFSQKMGPIRRKVGRLLREATVCEHAKTCSVAREIRKLEKALWTFVDHEEIEPTNNFAERTIRHAVLWRKCSLGTDSPNGSRFVERVLTTVATLRQQDRNVLDYLTAAAEARMCGVAAPSLLPVPA